MHKNFGGPTSTKMEWDIGYPQSMQELDIHRWGLEDNTTTVELHQHGRARRPVKPPTFSEETEGGPSTFNRRNADGKRLTRDRRLHKSARYSKPVPHFPNLCRLQSVVATEPQPHRTTPLVPKHTITPGATIPAS